MTALILTICAERRVYLPVRELRSVWTRSSAAQPAPNPLIDRISFLAYTRTLTPGKTRRFGVGQAGKMDPEGAGQITLHNDTVLNVAMLLREQTGAFRSYRFAIDRLDLDDDLGTINLAGHVRLTRLSDAILVAVNGQARVALECQRCLETYEQPVSVDFAEEFRIAYDVRRGTMIKSESGELDERLEISENHELDFSEPMRQEIIVDLPMRPVCGDQCPGPPEYQEEDDGPKGQFAALAFLLEPSDE